MNVTITAVLDPSDGTPWPLEYHPSQFDNRDAASAHFEREARHSQEYEAGDILTICTSDDSWRVVIQ